MTPAENRFDCRTRSGGLNAKNSISEGKWRLPLEAALLIEIKGNRFSSELQENHEHYWNKPAYCKAVQRGQINFAADVCEVSK